MEILKYLDYGKVGCVVIICILINMEYNKFKKIKMSRKKINILAIIGILFLPMTIILGTLCLLINMLFFTIREYIEEDF